MSPARTDVRVVGRRLVPEDHRLRDFLTRTAHIYEWIDADSPDAVALLESHGLTGAELPIVIEAQEVIVAATVERLVEAWQLDSAPLRSVYDLVIVGAGPAGLAASVYAASDGLSTLVLERDVPGGQASHTSLIENFFGFPGGIGGAELARLAGRQAEGFGAELHFLRGVISSRGGGEQPFVMDIAGGYQVSSAVAIAAPGMDWCKLELDGVEELLGRGVYYGAGRSEAAQCSGDPVVVVGAGNSAGQAVMNLANAGAHVTMAVRGDRLGKSMSAYLRERIEVHPLIDVRLRTQVTAVESEGGLLRGVTLSDGSAGTVGVPSRALFLCIGGVPHTGWASEVGVRVDNAGFILTGLDLLRDGHRPDGWSLARDPLALETSVAGLFAAGDVRSGSTKRVAAAVGEGSMAVALSHLRLQELAGAR